MSVMRSDSVAGIATPPVETGLGPWENSADPAYCRDLAGRLLAVNLSFARKFGRTAASLSGTLVSELVHPDDLPSLHATIAEITEPPHRAVCEHRWLTPQGIRWFSWEKIAQRAANGDIVAIRAVGRDITRQRLAEEQFYRISRAVEQSPVSIVITDLDGRPQYVNPKFTEVSGRTLATLLARPLAILRDGHSSEESYRKFLETDRKSAV